VDVVFTRSALSPDKGPLTLTWAGPLPQQGVAPSILSSPSPPQTSTPLTERQERASERAMARQGSTRHVGFALRRTLPRALTPCPAARRWRRARRASSRSPARPAAPQCCSMSAAALGTNSSSSSEAAVAAAAWRRECEFICSRELTNQQRCQCGWCVAAGRGERGKVRR
jgi:hypothetical protein